MINHTQNKTKQKQNKNKKRNNLQHCRIGTTKLQSTDNFGTISMKTQWHPYDRKYPKDMCPAALKASGAPIWFLVVHRIYIINK